VHSALATVCNRLIELTTLSSSPLYSTNNHETLQSIFTVAIMGLRHTVKDLRAKVCELVSLVKAIDGQALNRKIMG